MVGRIFWGHQNKSYLSEPRFYEVNKMAITWTSGERCPTSVSMKYSFWDWDLLAMTRDKLLRLTVWKAIEEISIRFLSRCNYYLLQIKMMRNIISFFIELLYHNIVAMFWLFVYFVWLCECLLVNSFLNWMVIHDGEC